MVVRKKKKGPLAPRMLTISEVAQLLHAHPNTVRLWSNDGLLKAYRLGRRGDRRFRPEDIDAFLRGDPPTDNQLNAFQSPVLPESVY